jgi:hypothetical protein
MYGTPPLHSCNHFILSNNRVCSISRINATMSSSWEPTSCPAASLYKLDVSATGLLYLPPATYWFLARFSYSSTLKMEATCSSETSADFQRTIRNYIPKYTTP